MTLGGADSDKPSAWSVRTTGFSRRAFLPRLATIRGSSKTSGWGSHNLCRNCRTRVPKFPLWLNQQIAVCNGALTPRSREILRNRLFKHRFWWGPDCRIESYPPYKSLRDGTFQARSNHNPPVGRLIEYSKAIILILKLLNWNVPIVLHSIVHASAATKNN